MKDPARQLALDSLDHAIIELLRGDGRMPCRRMASRLGVSESTVRSRMRRMEAADFMRVVAVTDLEAAGYGLFLAVGVQVEERGPAEVARELARLPEVFSVNVAVGTHDVECLVVASGRAALAQLLQQHIAQIPGVHRLTPSLAIDVIKNQPHWVPFRDQRQA